MFWGNPWDELSWSSWSQLTSIKGLECQNGKNFDLDVKRLFEKISELAMENFGKHELTWKETKTEKWENFEI